MNFINTTKPINPTTVINTTKTIHTITIYFLCMALKLLIIESFIYLYLLYLILLPLRMPEDKILDMLCEIMESLGRAVSEITGIIHKYKNEKQNSKPSPPTTNTSSDKKPIKQINIGEEIQRLNLKKSQSLRNTIKPPQEIIKKKSLAYHFFQKETNSRLKETDEYVGQNLSSLIGKLWKGLPFHKKAYYYELEKKSALEYDKWQKNSNKSDNNPNIKNSIENILKDDDLHSAECHFDDFSIRSNSDTSFDCPSTVECTRDDFSIRSNSDKGMVGNYLYTKSFVNNSYNRKNSSNNGYTGYINGNNRGINRGNNGYNNLSSNTYKRANNSSNTSSSNLSSNTYKGANNSSSNASSNLSNNSSSKLYETAYNGRTNKPGNIYKVGNIPHDNQSTISPGNTSNTNGSGDYNSLYKNDKSGNPKYDNLSDNLHPNRSGSDNEENDY
eukprot:GHVP01027276.1.p1 GENE.GHVP01027276.1~~GHVP01027276.1.p1  ORF type:complete len:443 (+),score=24.94 GHVP01027276.1:702-2030(+)